MGFWGFGVLGFWGSIFLVQGWDGIGWDGMGWDGMALAEGGVGRGLWSLKMVARLAAAGFSGGNWLLQGRCEAVTLAPLLMVLLL